MQTEILAILIMKGMLIGMIESSPMGPIGVLCVQRTLKKGRKYALATGAGAAISDIMYAFVTGLGLSFVLDFVNTEQNVMIMKIIASIILLAFGINIFRTDPEKCMKTDPQKTGSMFYNFITGFGLTLSNPLIILVFLALFNTFSFSPSADSVTEQIAGYSGIYIGAIIWWCFLTFLVSRMKQKFGAKGINIFNKTIGTIVTCIAIFNAVMLFV